MVQIKPHISIVNVVATATINQKLDLTEITKKYSDVEYDPEQFAGLILRLNNPRTTTLIFSTGNMVCTGATSEEMSIKAVNMVIQKIRKTKNKIKNNPRVTIQNVVSSINLKGKINLIQAAKTLPRSIYEPEQFSGIVHRMLDPKTVILLFASGKLICTGARREEEIYHSVNQIHSLLEEKNLMDYD
ncbi:MAG: TATA-box-binding protein [Nitrosopumilus sp.]|nr:TATA-box-binding protein [Nitrosopumilus sp.]